MHTLVAFSQSQDNVGVYDYMTAVVDQHVKTNGNDIIVPGLRALIGAASLLGATLPGNSRLVSPSIRRQNLRYITATHAGIVPSANSPKWLTPQTPYMLDVNESLNAQSDSNPAAAEQHSIMVVLADGPLNPIAGNMITVRGQITLALVAGAWTFSEINLIDDLPTGKYQCVGGRAVVAAGIAFRFIPVGGTWRPGGLTVPTVTGIEDPSQRNGALGLWFDFDTTQLPGVEIIGSAATGSATYDVFMDVLVK